MRTSRFKAKIQLRVSRMEELLSQSQANGMFANLNTGMIGVQMALAEAMDAAERYGFRGIDFSIEEAADLVGIHGTAYVRHLADAAGVRLANWGLPVDFRNDEAAWLDGLKKLPAQAALAAELGCRRTATWIMPCSQERSFDENFAFHRDRLLPIAQILADNGCRLGLEFVGPKTLRDSRQYPFIHTVSGMLELCDAIGAGNVGLLLDCYHLYTSHGSMDEVASLTNEQIVVVHVNDAPAGLAVDEQLDGVRELPGATGVIDIDRFLQGLAGIGYDGPVTAEPFSQRLRDLPDEEAIAETASAMKKIWQSAGLE